jgi:hypothetical protein
MEMMMQVSIAQVARVVAPTAPQALLREAFAGVDIFDASAAVTKDHAMAAAAAVDDLRAREQRRVLSEPEIPAIGSRDDMLDMVGDQMRAVAAVVQAIDTLVS